MCKFSLRAPIVGHMPRDTRLTPRNRLSARPSTCSMAEGPRGPETCRASGGKRLGSAANPCGLLARGQQGTTSSRLAADQVMGARSRGPDPDNGGLGGAAGRCDGPPTLYATASPGTTPWAGAGPFGSQLAVRPRARRLHGRPRAWPSTRRPGSHRRAGRPGRGDRADVSSSVHAPRRGPRRSLADQGSSARDGGDGAALLREPHGRRPARNRGPGFPRPVGARPARLDTARSPVTGASPEDSFEFGLQVILDGPCRNRAWPARR